MNNYEPIRAWVRQRLVEQEAIINKKRGDSNLPETIVREAKCVGAISELNLLLDLIHGLEKQEKFIAEALHIE